MHLMTRSSARVSAYWPFARPNGVRTPSTKTTSRSCRGTQPPRWVLMGPLGYWLVTTRGSVPAVVRLTPSGGYGGRPSADRAPHRRDVLRRRAAAGADQVDPQPLQAPRVLGEVGGGLVVLEVVADDLGQSGVRLGDEQQPLGPGLDQLGGDRLHLLGSPAA